MTTPAESATAPNEHQIVIIGAGPAGLTAAYQLAKAASSTSTVLEADDTVGGICRTVERDGWRFDIGGHRFFTKVPEVEAFWHEILPDEDFLLRPRMSRIYYDGKFFDYPLRAWNALTQPRRRSRRRGAWARTSGPGCGRPSRHRRRFEGWTASRFGWRLYRIFFKTYTEKVWGVPADADARPTGPRSGSRTSRSARPSSTSLLPKRNQTRHHLAHRGVPVPEARPRDDVGDAAATRSSPAAARCACERRVAPIEHAGGEARAVVVRRRRRGPRTRYAATSVISSMPLGALVRAMDPPAPADGAGRRRRPAPPRLPHRRPRRARALRLPRQLDLRPRARASSSAASRTSARGRRTW